VSTPPDHRLTAAEKAFLAGHKLARVDGDEPCLGLPEVFYPDRGAPGWRHVVAQAQRLCAGCRPLRRIECHAGAVRRHETEGIWGGEDFFARNNTSSAQNKRKRAERRAEREAS